MKRDTGYGIRDTGYRTRYTDTGIREAGIDTGIRGINSWSIYMMLWLVIC